MDFQYKLIVGNQTFYKEFEIPAELERVKLGSTSNCEFRLNSDFFFEDIFDDFVFVLKMFIKSWTDHISSVGDHLNCNLFKRHLHNKFFERECQQIFCQFFFHFCHLFKSFLQWKYYTIKKRM